MSKIVLPKLERPPATVLEHLIARFPHINAAAWTDRIRRGAVTIDGGDALNEISPYQHGMIVCYEREVPFEPTSDLRESILFRDSEILVVDKPHGMPVTPAGEYMERALLTRLQKKLGLPALAPAHRLDRDTAGVVLFVIDPAMRADYHRLFSDETIERQYLAVARVHASIAPKRWTVRNRIERGIPWVLQRIVDGPPNAATDVELLDCRGDLALFHLFPRTGKKHQLRIHMASIGFPIVGDELYGVGALDGETPLQLLARGLTFAHPRSRELRTFTSNQTLSLMSHFNNYS